MNILMLLFITCLCFILAYRFYTIYLGKVFNSSDSQPTPANTMADGRDYVAGKTSIVFSHHFASIAGGGPIIGPTVALLYGFYPSWLWIIIGGIFFGAVHDYTSLFISVREKGKSIVDVTYKTMGKWGFVLFIVFTLFLLVLVCGAFLSLTATALTSIVDLKTLQLAPDQTLLHTIADSKTGKIKGVIGGVASTSVIVITLFAPVIGYLLYKKGIKTAQAIIFSTIIAFSSIYVGLKMPVSFSPVAWMIILSVYCFFAAGMPVWIILQPRDFINSFILYGGIAALFVGIAAGGAHGLAINAPAFNIAGGQQNLGPVWPVMFITIACGAISGFHSLIASGTTSKQISKESDIKRIGFGGMLLESFLAAAVLIAVASGLSFSEYRNIVFPEIEGIKSNPVLAFSLGMGIMLNKALALPVYIGTIFGIIMVEGFLATTLDTAVRLGRYLLEELWRIAFKNPPFPLRSINFNAGIIVVLMFLLAFKQGFLIIWPIFGSANQLLAGLALIGVSVWLTSKAKPNWFAILPAIFMLATTIFSLSYLLLTKYIPTRNIALIAADIALLILSLGVIILAWNSLSAYRKGIRLSAPDLLTTDE